MSGLGRDGENPAVRNELSGSVEGNAVQIGRAAVVNIGGAPAEKAEVPHEIPELLVRFVNRKREVARAGGLLDPAGGLVRIAVFTGLPGVGKTATAQQTVASAAPIGVFPGGELFVDFARLRDGGGTAVSDGLADCLRVLGVDDKVMPSTLAGRVNLFRTRTRDVPILVMLDDVAEPAEVAPFVPSAAGSAVLVTSNRRLSELLLDDAAVVPVEPLSDEAGAELLTALCGESRGEPEAMRELARLCGGLPVVLRVAASRLRSHPSLRVADLVAEVVAEDSGLEPFEFPGSQDVASVFTACYRDLPEPAMRLYHALGLFPGADFDSDLVAALADDPVAQRRALGSLVEANLVVDNGKGRYHLHGLVRRHARGCAESIGDDACRSILGRVVEFYLRQAAFADLTVLGTGRLRITDHQELLGAGPNPFRDKIQGLRWLDEERTNLMSVLRAALAEDRYREAWQLAEAMTALYVNRRYLEDWIESTRLGVRAATLDEAPAAVARLRSFSSRAHTGLGDLDEALAALNESLPVAEALGHSRLVASVWELFGRFHDEKARLESGDEHWAEADSAYQRSLEMFTAAEDDRGAAFVTYFLGCSQHGRGRPHEALATLEDALERIGAVGDKRMAGRALAEVGSVHHTLGDGDRAVSTLQRAIEQLRAGEDFYYEAQACEVLAAVAEQQGNPVLRRENLARALEIHERFRSPRVDDLRSALAELVRVDDTHTRQDRALSDVDGQGAVADAASDDAGVDDRGQ